METLQGKQVLVTGGSRGFGRGIVEAMVGAGARVHTVARGGAALAALRADLADHVATTEADAADPVVAGHVLDVVRPDVVVLNAGASPLARSLSQLAWESFSRNWDVDVKIAFHWLREILLLPLVPGSAVLVFSSGAALQGSPLSGGYSGAKATLRFMARYAADESDWRGLGIRFTALLPQLLPATDMGRPAVAAYARRAGLTVEEFIVQLGTPLTPDLAGAAAVQALVDPAFAGVAALTVTSEGLRSLD